LKMFVHAENGFSLKPHIMIGVQQSLFQSSESSYLPEAYVLVVNPSTSVSRHVTRFKKHLMPMLGYNFGLPSKPHITIAGFPLGKEQVGRFSKRMEEICGDCTPFQLSLNGFGTFPGNGTIYVDVVSERSLSILYQKTAQMLRTAMHIPAEFAPKTFTPHITIVRNLDRLQDGNVIYQKLWADYEDAEYEASFQVDELVLLRYRSDGRTTELVRTFPLGNDLDALSLLSTSQQFN